MTRRQARRQALFLVYQWDLGEGEIGERYGDEIDPWARELAEETVAHAAELDVRITAAAEGWTADRLGVVERNAVRIGLFELERGGVPPEVAIDEAVELAKRYCQERAAAFVNGILGTIGSGRGGGGAS